MTSNLNGLNEVWQKLAETGSINGEELIKFFESKGQDAESAFAFYDEWKGRKVLDIPLKVAEGQTVKGTKVPIIVRLTDKTGRDFLKSQGYTLRR